MKQGKARRTISREDLKPRPLTDEQLLAEAIEETKKWLANKKQGHIHTP